MPLDGPACVVVSGLDSESLAGRTGAKVHDLKLSRRLSAGIIAALKRALLKYKVLFFRGQHRLDGTGQEAFAHRLGTPVRHPTLGPLEATEAVLDIDGEHGERATAWHTDATFLQAPPKIGILRAVKLPPRGGDTVWASTAAAHAELPESLRDFTETLSALHANVYGCVEAPPDASTVALRRFTTTVYRTDHRVVRVPPEIGERSLVLGQFAQRREENTARWRWSLGDVAIWDHRATQYRAIDNYGNVSRVVRRVSRAGDKLVSVYGRHSIAISVTPSAEIPASPTPPTGSVPHMRM